MPHGRIRNFLPISAFHSANFRNSTDLFRFARNMNKSIVALACLLCQAPLADAGVRAEQTYQDALAQARAGRLEPALQQMQILLDQYPDKKRYRYDYLQILAWANRDRDVLSQAELIEPQRAPLYVLEAIAKSAHHVGDYSQAETFYRLAIDKAPSRFEARLGLGWLLLDRRQPQAAADYLTDLAKDYPEQPDILRAQGYAEQQNGRFTQAAAFYRQILQQLPHDRDAQLQAIKTLTVAGRLEQAAALADSYRSVLSDEQWAALMWDRAAMWVREGQRALTQRADDFASTDRAIAALQTNLDALERLQLQRSSDWRLRAQADLLVALRDRRRFTEAAALQDRLPPGHQWPSYARQALADAYRALGQPRRARQLYAATVADEPDDFDALMALAYADLDAARNKQLDSTLARLDQLSARHPEMARYRYDYLQLLSHAGRNRRLLQQATELDIEQAPPYVLEAIAKAARNLHDYDRAERYYRLAEQRAPERLEPRLGLAWLAIDRHQAKSAIAALQNLAARFADHPDIALAQGYAYELAGQPQQAVRCFRQALRDRADSSDARRGLIRALAASGAIDEAAARIEQDRALLTDEQWAAIRWDYAAWLVRRSDARAIATLQTNQTALATLKLAEASRWATRAEADLLTALHAATRWDEVIDRYRQLQDRGVELPSYAQRTVADAYRQLRQPQAAAALYQMIVARDDEDLAAWTAWADLQLQTGQNERLTQTLQRIDELIVRHPAQADYRYDYLQLLFRADRHADALQQAAAIDLANAPVAVLETLAKAARHLGETAQAERLYRLAAEQAPERFDPRLGLGLLLLDDRRTEQARSYLQQLAARYPDRVETLLAQAYVEEQAGRFEHAVDFYRQVLSRQADNAEAGRGLALALIAAGQPQQAMQVAQDRRTLFSDEQWATVRWQYAAWQVRQGEQALNNNPQDYRAVDVAIAELEANIAAVAQLTVKDPAVWSARARFDLMVALRDRKRMSDVLTLYRSLQQQAIELPAYAQIAAADAYLNNRQPEQARDLYRAVAEAMPDNVNAKVSLVYAYLEAEQPDQALALAEQLAAEQPERIENRQPDGSLVEADNPRRLAAELTAAVFRAYTDDLDTAQHRLQALHHRYPQHAGIHNKLAEIYYFRGWPRRAEQTIRAARQTAPDDFGLQLTQAKIAHSLHDEPTTHSLMRALQEAYPQDSGVQKQQRLRQRYHSPTLKLFANGGISSNAASGPNPFTGSNHVGIDGYLYSAPIDGHFRAFTHQGWKSGLFKEGRGNLAIFGAGLEYAGRDATVAAELHYDDFQKQAVGADLSLDYAFDDHWQGVARLSSLDNGIALRALHGGISARSAKIGIGYRASESRQFNLLGGVYDFSDGNERHTLDGSYFQRWYSGPFYKFSTVLNAGTSHNGTSDGPYFSPTRDALTALTLDNELLTYRHYETAFTQRLALTVGDYWQQRYGNNLVGNLLYEHRWRFVDAVELVYGGVKGYRYYDGDQTDSWQLYLTADIRF